MSDRRPEKLYVHRDDRVCQLTREATSADLLAVVRRGVESGTIERSDLVDALGVDGRKFDLVHGRLIRSDSGRYWLVPVE